VRCSIIGSVLTVRKSNPGLLDLEDVIPLALCVGHKLEPRQHAIRALL
jgi:hypothetical protein